MMIITSKYITDIIKCFFMISKLKQHKKLKNISLDEFITKYNDRNTMNRAEFISIVPKQTLKSYIGCPIIMGTTIVTMRPYAYSLYKKHSFKVALRRSIDKHNRITKIFLTENVSVKLCNNIQYGKRRLLYNTEIDSRFAKADILSQHKELDDITKKGRKIIHKKNTIDIPPKIKSEQGTNSIVFNALNFIGNVVVAIVTIAWLGLALIILLPMLLSIIYIWYDIRGGKILIDSSILSIIIASIITFLRRIG
jgi:hypothetical protein